MIDLAGYSFQNNKASIVCTHVWNGQPVLLYLHDSDGDIQFFCGEDNHFTTAALVLGLAELEEQLRSMLDLPAVDAGQCAERSHVGGPWKIQSMDD